MVDSNSSCPGISILSSISWARACPPFVSSGRASPSTASFLALFCGSCTAFFISSDNKFKLFTWIATTESYILTVSCIPIIAAGGATWNSPYECGIEYNDLSTFPSFHLDLPSSGDDSRAAELPTHLPAFRVGHFRFLPVPGRLVCGIPSLRSHFFC
ncbi:hypothetical protein J6590_012443 [Homalodisca vitripennis]|nr:hypothetical protein J6590_012443 [Homalodisca vitripennis]